jgi:hypothetical protein
MMGKLTSAEATRRLKNEFHWTAVEFERWGINAYSGEERRRLLNEAYELEVKDRRAAERMKDLTKHLEG